LERFSCKQESFIEGLLIYLELVVTTFSILEADETARRGRVTGSATNNKLPGADIAERWQEGPRCGSGGAAGMGCTRFLVD
jgi:hypothetical protein